MIPSNHIRESFISYFESKQHRDIGCSSLLPENDNTTLFTSAGMQPLKKYLSGSITPPSNRLVNYQKCIRINDIENIGDETHLTMFEMLGNWSIGDYGKEESIRYAYEYLTRVLGVASDRLTVTVHTDDDESYDVWNSIFNDPSKISRLSDNWWEGSNLCGYDTEIFYDGVEIWNVVFMFYERNTADGTLKNLETKCIDTGMGLERITALINNKPSVYDTDLFEYEEDGHRVSLFDNVSNIRDARIIKDHMRASVFIIGNTGSNIKPDRRGVGSILRKLIRRVINILNVTASTDDSDTLAAPLSDYCNRIIGKYGEYYPELLLGRDMIIDTIIGEYNLYMKQYVNFRKCFSKIKDDIPTDEDIFKLYTVNGVPIDVIEGHYGNNIDVKGIIDRMMNEHRNVSRSNVKSKMFKSGLINNSENAVIFHTLTHILHYVLREIVFKGADVRQSGSNINEERLRFDFNLAVDLNDNIIREIDYHMYSIVRDNTEVKFRDILYGDAVKEGYIGLFEYKTDTVRVYDIGPSKEICSGPHVNNLSNIPRTFNIYKYRSSSNGIKRIYIKIGK